jgi:hypothetical protein
MRHTPGPWLATYNGAFWEITPKDAGKKKGRTNIPFSVGDVCASDPENPNSGIQEANARLMAASPKLLAKLIQARDALRIWAPKDAHLAQIDQVIFEATGENL